MEENKGLPAAGGSYVKQPDGTLKQVAATQSKAEAKASKDEPAGAKAAGKKKEQ